MVDVSVSILGGCMKSIRQNNTVELTCVILAIIIQKWFPNTLRDYLFSYHFYPISTKGSEQLGGQGSERVGYGNLEAGKNDDELKTVETI